MFYVTFGQFPDFFRHRSSSESFSSCFDGYNEHQHQHQHYLRKRDTQKDELASASASLEQHVDLKDRLIRAVISPDSNHDQARKMY
ncbi:unnamed protein product [Hermetia illucens]|uniref:Uncharacterized protein n=1 Tax=Hermetia illucens TaxID=343691 RepID=A0A7R8YT71_HERIL|nr:unnamed protein product [Hermetia illucens]